MIKKTKCNRQAHRIQMTDDAMKKKYRIVQVKGNGHCLFRSIAQVLHHELHGLLLNQKDEFKFALNLRRLAISEVCSHDGQLKLNVHAHNTYKKSITKEIQFKNFERYCDCQYDIMKESCKPERLFTWGGFHEINALAHLLHIPILVYVKKGENDYDTILFCKKFERKPLRIIYVHNRHYNALVPK